ncbi:hypothetical protein H7K13_23840 [Priestia aryabhattai]|uniref:hypothetical protein n=1 Tax=Priestia aryabhattai TaxID=412384 RepID=UPI001C8E56CB|nr:hypothetical protein [Priestia aryabhattai]MBY0077962.1 hypothetical protein [Priestia aryabhattai]
MGEFVGVGFKKNLGKAKNHIKYIAFRERSDGKNYGLFNDRSDNVNVYKFTKTLEDKKISHSSVAKIHTVMLTMSGDEFKRSGFVEEDYKKMVRNLMEDWQLKEGKRVNWVAALHNEDGHPHVHVAIKSTYTDRNGIERRLKMDVKTEREWFRKQFREEKDLIRGHDWYEKDRQFRFRERGRDKSLTNGIAGDFVKNLIFEMKKRQLEEAYERDIEQIKTQRRSQGRSR